MRTLLALTLAFSLPLLAEKPTTGLLPTAKPEDLGMSSEKLNKIGPAIKQLIADQKLAGGAVLVLRNGHIVYHETFGHRTIESGDKMQKDTIFRIYSMTKAITSAAALMLVEEGKLSLDDPVSKYIPSFNDLKVWSDDGNHSDLKRQPTVRDLLRHTTGFSREKPFAELYRKHNPSNRDHSLEDLANALAKIPLADHPGQQWIYGLSSDTLARVTEVAAKQPFDTLIQSRLLTPLGMNDTSFHVPADKLSRFSTVYTNKDGKLIPHEKIEGSKYLTKPTLLAGGSGLVSTITDYGRFLQMIANGGTFQGKQYLKKESVALMTTNQLPDNIPHISFGEQQRHGTGFGLGFSVRTAHDDRWDKDSALGEWAWGGFLSTHYWASPQHKLIVVTMEQTFPYNWNMEHTVKPLVYDAVLDQ